MGNKLIWETPPKVAREVFPMGKNGLDREEIIGYIREGWRFRIKTVKGRRYITRRRGQKERGLGAYEEESWNSISQLVRQAAETGTPQIVDILETEVEEPFWVTQKGARFDEDFGRLKGKLSMHRGLKMMMDCGHRDEEGFCTYWRWEDEPDFLELTDRLFSDYFYTKKTVFKEGHVSERWVFRAVHWYCWGCAAYQSTGRGSHTRP